jgi:hypothetical protein
MRFCFKKKFTNTPFDNLLALIGMEILLVCAFNKPKDCNVKQVNGSLIMPETLASANQIGWF